MKVKNFKIIDYKSYEELQKWNYTIPQLKMMLKHYKQKVGGRKRDLYDRLFIYLKMNNSANKIQYYWLQYILKKYKFNQHRHLDKTVNNHEDFYTLDNINNISKHVLYYLKQENHIYAFHLESIEKLLSSNKINPYNRKEISTNDITSINICLKLSTILKLPYKTIEHEVLTESQIIDFKITDICQILEAHGFMVDPNWFRNLTKVQIINFIKELYDIWNYRASLSPQAKSQICPPYGDPFRMIIFNQIHLLSTISLKNNLINILNNFLSAQNDHANQYLGTCYILQALTLVSYNAAAALPWLYQTMI